MLHLRVESAEDENHFRSSLVSSCNQVSGLTPQRGQIRACGKGRDGAAVLRSQGQAEAERGGEGTRQGARKGSVKIDGSYYEVVIPFKVRSIATPDPVVHQHISVRGSSVFVPTIGESSGHTPREEAESLLGPAKVKGIG